MSDTANRLMRTVAAMKKVCGALKNQTSVTLTYSELYVMIEDACKSEGLTVAELVAVQEEWLKARHVEA